MMTMASPPILPRPTRGEPCSVAWGILAVYGLGTPETPHGSGQEWGEMSVSCGANTLPLVITDYVHLS